MKLGEGKGLRSRRGSRSKEEKISFEKDKENEKSERER